MVANFQQQCSHAPDNFTIVILFLSLVYVTTEMSDGENHITAIFPLYLLLLSHFHFLVTNSIYQWTSFTRIEEAAKAIASSKDLCGHNKH